MPLLGLWLLVAGAAAGAVTRPLDAALAPRPLDGNLTPALTWPVPFELDANISAATATTTAPPPPPHHWRERQLEWVPVLASVLTFCVFLLAVYVARYALGRPPFDSARGTGARALRSCVLEPEQSLLEDKLLTDGQGVASEESFGAQALRLLCCAAGVISAQVLYALLQEKVMTKRYNGAADALRPPGTSPPRRARQHPSPGRLPSLPLPSLPPPSPFAADATVVALAAANRYLSLAHSAPSQAASSTTPTFCS